LLERRLVVTHVHDLISLALGATRDGGELADRRGLAAARLRAIKADIARRAANIDLGITSIPRMHGVTPRYIQILFEEDGTTFSGYLGIQRLALAHRLLADPNDRRKISDIALAAGFGNVSYFNRAFRRLFGATPSDIRSRDG
jgi:AraC-like DNA-binding protein